MQFRKLLTAVLAVVIACDGMVETKTKASTTKSSAKKSSKTKSRAARRTGSPRQMAPTPERYTEIQQALADKGYYDGPANGQWGPECVDALKRFQQDQSLDPDGKLGSLSLIALGLGPKRQIATDLQAKPTASEPQ